mmetsp:Transcript_43505/g.170187  ORF Transcript_43505/g.170187 Transcript_43505/m.170187 type:complete len:289 (-) Transcript_43505:2235-3101(-)
MEKYRNTADHSTGIHPFIPIVGVGFPVLNVVLAPVFLAVRVPVFLVGACLLVLSEFIGPISSLAAKTLLVAFGASRVEEKLLRPGADDTPEIIVANHGSFIDVLHVASRFSARTFVIYDAGDRKFVSKSLLKAILHSFSSADVPSSTDNKVLEVDFKAIKYPALVLPEGTTSNGRGLLTFESGAFRGVDRGKKITLVGFNYGNPRVVTFSATYTVGSSVFYLLKMLAHSRCIVSTRISALTTQSSDPSVEIRKALTNAAQVPLLSVGHRERAEFERNWRSTQGTKAYS